MKASGTMVQVWFKVTFIKQPYLLTHLIMVPRLYSRPCNKQHSSQIQWRKIHHRERNVLHKKVPVPLLNMYVLNCMQFFQWLRGTCQSKTHFSSLDHWCIVFMNQNTWYFIVWQETTLNNVYTTVKCKLLLLLTAHELNITATTTPSVHSIKLTTCINPHLASTHLYYSMKLHIHY